jgi:hypothetical protein
VPISGKHAFSNDLLLTISIREQEVSVAYIVLSCPCKNIAAITPVKV